MWKDLVEYYKKKILPAMVPKVLKSSFLIARNDFKFEMIELLDCYIVDHKMGDMYFKVLYHLLSTVRQRSSKCKKNTSQLF